MQSLHLRLRGPQGPRSYLMATGHKRKQQNFLDHSDCCSTIVRNSSNSGLQSPFLVFNLVWKKFIYGYLSNKKKFMFYTMLPQNLIKNHWLGCISNEKWAKFLPSGSLQIQAWLTVDSSLNAFKRKKYPFIPINHSPNQHWILS